MYRQSPSLGRVISFNGFEWRGRFRLGGGDEDAARAALERAAKGEANRPGKLDGEGFLGIRDYDDLLGSVLEVYAGETYLWLPFDQIRKLTISKPKHLLLIPLTIFNGMEQAFLAGEFTKVGSLPVHNGVNRPNRPQNLPTG